MSTDGKKGALALVKEYSIPLIAGVVSAVLWANVDFHGYEALIHASPFGHDSHFNFHFFVNDLFMALFFGIATKEITESCLPGGSLNPISRAVNPLLGTLGGVLGPIGVYFAWVAITGDAAIASGWGIPTATDIALAWLVARMAFGAGHPAVSYLLLLAVADDGIGLGIIAIFYPDPAHPVQPMFLVFVGLAMFMAYMMRRRAVLNFWLYLAGPGVVSWCGLYFAHLHPALALVAVVPFMPSKGFDMGMFAEADSDIEFKDTLDLFAHTFHGPVTFGLFAFGLANAGVVFSSMGNATWAVFLALVVGKTMGVFMFAFVGSKLGFPLPNGMDVRSLFVAGLTAALGLTVALFVAGVAFTDPTLQGAAKMGALFSAGVAVLVLVSAKVLGIKRIDVAAHQPRTLAEAEAASPRPPAERAA